LEALSIRKVLGFGVASHPSVARPSKFIISIIIIIEHFRLKSFDASHPNL
jgi:hypothetical protein